MMTSRTKAKAERAVISFKKNSRRPKEEEFLQGKDKNGQVHKKMWYLLPGYDLTISRLVANVSWGIGREW